MSSSSSSSSSSPGVPPVGLRREIVDFILRLHFYIGLFVGPFILIAAVTGVLYVLTPQIENALFKDVLTTASTGPARSLGDQVNAARAYLKDGRPVFAVRPATAEGRTTRVMFTDPKLGESETQAIFVDPVTLEIKGDLTVYGTSGVLPLRLAIDKFHRNLMLGDLGRNYSELAASWLWIATLGGVVLWLARRKGDAAAAAAGGRVTAAARTRRLHSTTGLWVALGLAFLSVTGLTWSKYAGDNIDALRQSLGWVTPSVSLKIDPTAPAAPAMSVDHADHAQHSAAAAVAATPAGAVPDPAALIDAVHATAIKGGIDSPLMEIRPSKVPEKAWMVREYDRSTPTQVDTVAIDPRSMTITSRADFDTFTIIPKLIRWGIDIHMGIKFGVINQIVMVVLGSALCLAIVYGYRLWWMRRPAAGAPARTLLKAWQALSPVWKVGTVLVAAGLGYALPVMGVSLLAFLLVDILRWQMARRARSRRGEARAAAE